MSAINFPLATTSLFVNTLTTNKIIYLPAASTIGAGRLFYIKDICGNAARSSIYISTIGMDRIENRHQPSTLYAVMSTNYGSILMAPDGALNWYFLQHYHRNAISSLGAVVAVATGAFTPTSITGLRMWFDAADAATLTLSSGIVTQWADKSGTGNTLIPLSGKANATVSSAYQNGLNVLNFSGNSLYRSPLGSATYPQDVYIIVALKSLTAHNDVLGMGDTTADNFNSFTFAENVARRWQNGSSFGSRLIYSPTDETSTSFLLMQWSIANNNFLLRRNGTQLVQSSSITYSFSNPSAAAFQIGYRHTDQTGASNFSGYIGEILLFNTQLGTTDREKIEGYLAWKWGLQASLPAGHSYLNAPPGGTGRTYTFTGYTNSPGTPISYINSSSVTNGAITFSGSAGASETNVFYSYTNDIAAPVAKGVTKNASRDTINLPANTTGTQTTFLSYGPYDTSYTLAGSMPTGFSASAHTVIIIMYHLGTTSALGGSSGQGNNNSVTSGGIMYQMGRSSVAGNFAINGQLVVGENGAWDYNGGFSMSINSTTVNIQSKVGWVMVAFVWSAGNTCTYYYNGSTAMSSGGGNGASAVAGTIYIGVDQRATYYNGVPGSCLNAEIAFYGLWNSALTATQIGAFYTQHAAQFSGGFV
jgi:hypothetical protein